MIKKWLQTSKELISTEFLWKHFKIGYNSQTSDIKIKFDVLDCPDWINIIAINEEQKVIMVKQFRSGINDITLEFPAGGVNLNETSEDAAIRELSEETGSHINSIKLIGKSNPNPAFLTNTLWTYLSENVQISKAQNLDDTEEIEIVLVPINKIDEKIKNGEIVHSLTITSWYFFKNKS